MGLPLVTNVKQKRSSLHKTKLWSSWQAKWNYWQGKTDLAIQTWVDLLNEDSDKLRLKEVTLLIKAQAFQEAVDYLEGLDMPKLNEPEVLCLLARCYLGQALIPQARAMIERALNLKPQQAEYWEILADCYLELGNWEEGVKALDNSCRLEPKNAATRYRLGTIYAYHEDYPEALKYFQGCCQLESRESLYWEVKGEMHVKLEQMADACISFDRALRYGGTPDLAARLAYCYIQTGQIKKGIQYYKFALKYEPDHYDAISNLAAVYQNQERDQEAMNLLERALKIYPEDPILLNNLGFTLVQQGRSRKAVEYYKKALELSPEHPLILYNLSVCHARKGNWNESIQSLNKLVETDPDYTAGWALLGNIYDQMDQYETAIDCYNKALKLA